MHLYTFDLWVCQKVGVETEAKWVNEAKIISLGTISLLVYARMLIQLAGYLEVPLSPPLFAECTGVASNSMWQVCEADRDRSVYNASRRQSDCKK